MTPAWVAAILESRLFLFLARLLLAAAFLVPGVIQALQFHGALGEFAHFGLHPTSVYVIASIVTLLAGSALVIVGGRWTWLGAGALGIYTGLTIIIVHHVWTMHGPEAVTALHTVLEHIALIGGLMLVAVHEHSVRKVGG